MILSLLQLLSPNSGQQRGEGLSDTLAGEEEGGGQMFDSQPGGRRDGDVLQSRGRKISACISIWLHLFHSDILILFCCCNGK